MIRKIQARDAILARGHYSTPPNEILTRKDISTQAKLIWIYLMSQDPNWKSSRNNIGRNLGLSANTVTKALKQLEAANMLKVDRSGMQWSFDLIDPGMWINPDPVRKNNRIKSDPVQLKTGSDLIQKRITFDPHSRNNKNPKNEFGASFIGDPSRPFEGGRRGPSDRSQQEKEDLEIRFRLTMERVAREKEAMYMGA